MLNPLIGGSLILMKRIKKFPSVKSGDDSENCRNAKDGLFRYQQLHANSPSYKDAFKSSTSKGEK